MALKNVMEEIVREKINSLLTENDCCKCSQCVEDMECLALNSLPAKYVSTLKGQLFSKLSQSAKKQSMVDVNIACINAINLVKSNPKHEER